MGGERKKEERRARECGNAEAVQKDLK